TTMERYVPGTTTAYAYKPGRDIYIGTNPTQTLIDYTSNEKQVTARTPPAFLNWGTSDNLVNPLNSMAYRDSLTARGVAVKTVVVPGGGHEPGTARLDSLRAWMDASGFMTPTSIRARPLRARRAPAQAPRSDAAPDALGRMFRDGRTTGAPLNLPLKDKESQ